MRWSEMLLATLKEVPAEAEAVSHILMLRAGLIRKLTSGVYSYLPLGLRVLRNIERIIREEMNNKGAQEVFLPAIQPVELWIKSGRFEALGEDMIKFTDRHKKVNVMGPTHEEVITSLVKNEVSSYRQLPLVLYQIQTKFRDEARPRFGVIRSREFIMKDAYSFDRDKEGLNKSYEKMYDAYCRIFKRCGLNFIAVEADTGVMGGDVSHEFMVLAENGEDKIASCSKCDYAASLDKAECVQKQESGNGKNITASKELTLVDTPQVSSVKDVASFLKVGENKLVKTLIYLSNDSPVAVLLRGDHEVNENKLKRVLKSACLIMADEKIIQEVTGGPLGFSGPVGLRGIKILSDFALKSGADFVVGANKQDAHFTGASLDRDFKVDIWADLRNITATDKCPRCAAQINIKNAIEVGHVFKLGTKYTQCLGATFLDDAGKANDIIMGCYGIGVTRIIAASIENNQDENGIKWPMEIAPFQVEILPLNADHGPSKLISEELYKQLLGEGLDVLLDDRNIRAGIKFKDADLIGIPIHVIIGEKSLLKGEIEVKIRSANKVLMLKKEEVSAKIRRIIKEPGAV